MSRMEDLFGIMSRETVSLELAKLIRSGRIAVEDRYFVIPSYAKT
jgi:hypothetical protein